MNGTESDSGLAGIIGVRGDAIEALTLQEGDHFDILSMAMLEEQPAARIQMLGRVADDGP